MKPYCEAVPLPADLVEGRKEGVIDLLDEECKLPKGSPQHFTDAVHSTHREHFRLNVSCLSVSVCLSEIGRASCRERV